MVIEEIQNTISVFVYKISPETKNDPLQQDYQQISQDIFKV